MIQPFMIQGAACTFVTENATGDTIDTDGMGDLQALSSVLGVGESSSWSGAIQHSDTDSDAGFSDFYTIPSSDWVLASLSGHKRYLRLANRGSSVFSAVSLVSA